MIITNEVKTAIEGTAFVPLVTINPDGTPHLIIAGKGEAKGDDVVFGIYKMEQTQKNLTTNKFASAAVATMDGKPAGYRLIGTAVSDGKALTLSVENVEQLI